MKKFLNPAYWFDVWPGSPDVRFWRLLAGFAVFVLVIAIAASIVARRSRHDGVRRRFFMKLAGWGYTVGPVFLILAFFRFQRAYFLGMRFWYLLWSIVALVWLIVIVKYRIVNVPKKIREREEREAFSKYLPRRQ